MCYFHDFVYMFAVHTHVYIQMSMLFLPGKTRGSSSSADEDAYAHSVEKGGSMRAAK